VSKIFINNKIIKNEGNFSVFLHVRRSFQETGLGLDLELGLGLGLGLDLGLGQGRGQLAVL
jgi:hypothetical protein